MKKLFQKFLCGLIVAVSMLTCFCSCTASIDDPDTPNNPIPSEVEFSTEFDLENGIVATDLTELSEEDAFQNAFYVKKNLDNFVGKYFKVKGIVHFALDKKISDSKDFSDFSKMFFATNIEVEYKAENKAVKIFFDVSGKDERYKDGCELMEKYDWYEAIVVGQLGVLDFNDEQVPCLRNATIELVEE